MKRLLRSGVKFLLVGGLSTAIELTAFNLLAFMLGWDPVSAKVVSSLIALVNAYVGNREWAFRDRRDRSRWREVARFLLVNAGCTAIGAGLVALGAIVGSADPIALNLINLASIAMVVVVRFVLYHFVVFLPSSPPDSAVRAGVTPPLSA